MNALVADVLLYDKLLIPCPPPTDEAYKEWCERGWKPTTQARILRMIDGLYEPVFWNEERRKRFREYAARRFEERKSSPATEAVTTTEVAARANIELQAIGLTRELIANDTGCMLFERQQLPDGPSAADIKIIPAYRSTVARRAAAINDSVISVSCRRPRRNISPDGRSHFCVSAKTS